MDKPVNSVIRVCRHVYVYMFVICTLLLLTVASIWWTNYTTSSTFYSSMIPLHRSSLRRTVAALVSAFDAAEIVYWMDGGTLIGSVRHHDLIPWDDDVDFVVLSSSWDNAKSALDSLSPRYEYCAETRWKKRVGVLRVYPRNDSSSNSYGSVLRLGRCRGLRYPAVDVLLADQNATHVWLATYGRDEYVWSRDRVIFPLTRRPLGETLNVPAPCDVDAYLRHEYRDSDISTECVSRSFDHSTFIGVRASVVDCRLLRDTYPFVRLTQRKSVLTAKTAVVELLEFRNRTLGEFVRETQSCGTNVTSLNDSVR